MVMNKAVYNTIGLMAILSTVGLFAISCSCDEDGKVGVDDGDIGEAGINDEPDAPIFSDDDDNDIDVEVTECDPPKVLEDGYCACPAGTNEDRNGDCITCKEGQEWNERRQQCVDHRCESDFECCPHYACNAAGECVPRFPACSNDDACADETAKGYLKGQTCRDGVCNYAACGSDKDCSSGFSCFNKYCVPKAPCKGKCKTNEVCITPIDQCLPAPKLADETNKWYRYKEASQIEGCDQSCETGYLLVYREPSVTYTASCEHAKCGCEPIPPLPFGDTSIYSSIALHNGEVIASAYNQTYGDLMLVSFDEKGVARKDTGIILDGAPTSGEVVGDPTRFRGGIADAGDDVGIYTSIGVDTGGGIHISYYDRTNGNLKYARNATGNVEVGGEAIGTDEVWSIEVVDDSKNAGMYSDLEVVPDERGMEGNLLLAYFVRDDGNGMAGVRVVSRPATATDVAWEKVYEELVPIAGPPCGGACSGSDVCIELNGVETCVPTASGCDACAADEACYDAGDGAKCFNLALDLGKRAIPEGVGVMPDIASAAGRTAMCYYDNTLVDKAEKIFKGDLALVVAEPDGSITRSVIDGNAALDGSGEDTGNVGFHCSVALSDDGTVIGVAYQDVDRNELKFWMGTDAENGGAIYVDTGSPEPGKDFFVGADNVLVFSQTGNPVIAYQDSSNHRLLLVESADGGMSFSAPKQLKPEAGEEGAWGFFINMLRDGNLAYISNVKIGYDPNARKGEVIPLNTLMYFTRTLP